MPIRSDQIRSTPTQGTEPEACVDGKLTHRRSILPRRPAHSTNKLHTSLPSPNLRRHPSPPPPLRSAVVLMGIPTMWRLGGRWIVPARKPPLGLRPASTSAAVTSCRAVLLPRFGGPEVLEVRSDVAVPDLKAREILVRARAVSINPLDLRMRCGYGRCIFEPLLPIILGRDISGEVAAVGASVSSLAVGQEVFGALHPTAVRGTYADYAILSEDELAVKPASITHVEASAIPFAALTAWRALKSTARITDGQRVLVIGGGGAVGLAAIQIAVAAGCSVSTTCGSQSIDRVLSVGAEQAIDYTAEDIEDAIKGQFDVVLDTIGAPETEKTGINLLRKGGHYMTLQGEAASLADRYGLPIGLPAATAILLKKQLQYRYLHGIDYWWTYMRADAEGLHEIRRLSTAGMLKIPVDKVFPIAEVQKAHEVKQKRSVPGKVVLEVV